MCKSTDKVNNISGAANGLSQVVRKGKSEAQRVCGGSQGRLRTARALALALLRAT
jgi:ABC-type phosphate transport system ATPase subunit